MELGQPLPLSGPQTSRRPHRDPASFSGRRGPGEAAGGEAAGGGDRPGNDRVPLGPSPLSPRFVSWGTPPPTLAGMEAGAARQVAVRPRPSALLCTCRDPQPPSYERYVLQPAGAGRGAPGPLHLPFFTPPPPPRRLGAPRASLGTSCIPPLPRAPFSWNSQTIT